MKALDLYRWAGIAGIVAGLLNLVAELLPERTGARPSSDGKVLNKYRRYSFL